MSDPRHSITPGFAWSWSAPERDTERFGRSGFAETREEAERQLAEMDAKYREGWRPFPPVEWDE